MIPSRAKKRITDKLSECGISVAEEEENKLCDIVVRRKRFWTRNLVMPNVGLNDGYIHEDWITTDLEKCLTRLIDRNYLSLSTFQRRMDLGDDLYRAMLDPYWQYSCGWWLPNIHSLEAAQNYKMELVCTKLQLYAGLRVLDIGCKWGGLLQYMQERYKVIGIGLATSQEHITLGKKLFPKVTFVLEDHRTYCTKHPEEFDRAVCIEHDIDYSSVRNVLKKDSLFLIENTQPLDHLCGQVKGLFRFETVSDVAIYYARTLSEWKKRAISSYTTLQSTECRSLIYYLTVHSVAFALRRIPFWQVMLSSS
jgi:cyclopropane-fatty-acyl-phospholipid synthase